MIILLITISCILPTQNYQDFDKDGFASNKTGGSDCDDNNALIHPFAEEVCNGIDDNCNNKIDESLTNWYFDFDQDGYGSKLITSCLPPFHSVKQSGDCNDNDPIIHPRAMELCDGIDQDCDGEIDEGLDPLVWYIDKDQDGFGGLETIISCEEPSGYVTEPGDCDDNDFNVNPSVKDLCDGFDYNCDGEPDSGCICGDGITSGIEDCDLSDDLECPGSCSNLCACPAADPGDLRIIYFDVGQGDSALIISPDGFVTLVDAGTSSNGAKVSERAFNEGYPKINYTINSHVHTDHYGGLSELIPLHPEVVACYDNGGDSNTQTFTNYIDAAGDRRIGLKGTEEIDIGPLSTLNVIHSNIGSNDENNNSVVFLVKYGNVTLFFGGDCESECENELSLGSIDVLKVNHHGSSSSSTSQFLEQTKPKMSIISCGIDNNYGHPSSYVVSSLEDYGKVLITDTTEQYYDDIFVRCDQNECWEQ